MNALTTLPSARTRPLVLTRISSMFRAEPKGLPDEWARANRVYPRSAGKPGPRDPGLTPYIIPFERFFDDLRYETCVLITGTQMSKTDAVLDVIGWRLATRPRPQLYVGPSKDFVVEQFEPRLMALFDQSDRLRGLVARGKRNKKTRKLVNGVPIRLAWAGSATSLASDQAGDVFVDEFDKMKAISGDGDAFTLAKARADTFPDRKIAVTSTPTAGRVDVEKCPTTGLEFWKPMDPRDIESPIWLKWQAGTRHHWAWCCPHCREWFIPRMRDLQHDKGATPAAARRKTWLACPVNGCIIEESEKAVMNAEGRFVAPGEVIAADAFLADTFASPAFRNGDYKLTAALTELLLQSDTDVKPEGLIWPSVAHRGGFNLAIKPEIFDSRFCWEGFEALEISGSLGYGLYGRTVFARAGKPRDDGSLNWETPSSPKTEG